MMRSICTLCLFVLSLAASAAGDNTIYRWTDANGQVHFGQFPPQGQRYEEVSPRGARKSAALDQAPTDTGLSGDVETFLKRSEEARKAEEKAENEAQQKLEIARRNCDSARERERFLIERGSRRLATEDDDGNVSRMDEVEFQRRLGEVRDKMKAFCQ